MGSQALQGGGAAPPSQAIQGGGEAPPKAADKVLSDAEKQVVKAAAAYLTRFTIFELKDNKVLDPDEVLGLHGWRLYAYPPATPPVTSRVAHSTWYVYTTICM